MQTFCKRVSVFDRSGINGSCKACHARPSTNHVLEISSQRWVKKSSKVQLPGELMSPGVRPPLQWFQREL